MLNCGFVRKNFGWTSCWIFWFDFMLDFLVGLHFGFVISCMLASLEKKLQRNFTLEKKETSCQKR
jgi:hypothetical protein